MRPARHVGIATGARMWVNANQLSRWARKDGERFELGRTRVFREREVRMITCTKAAISGALLIAALNAVAQDAWTLTRLPDKGNAVANAINNLGQVVGSTWNANTSSSEGTAVLWRNGSMTHLYSLSGSSVASDINDAGQVVGTSLGLSGTDVAAYRATLWQGGRIVELPTADLGGFSGATAINASGTVVGYLSSGLTVLPMVWSNGQTTVLPVPTGFESAGALGINKSGHILLDVDSPPSVFVGVEGSFTNIGHLFPDTPWTFARGINDAGQVVGSSYDLLSGTQHAFLWGNGQMRDLGTPAGFSDSMAVAINASGQVVGLASRSDPLTGAPTDHAILWDGTRIVDLTAALGDAAEGRTIRPNDINDAGVIVGEAVDPGRRGSYAFVLTPVPEPGTPAMLLAGAVVLASRLRRRRARPQFPTQRTRYSLAETGKSPSAAI